VFYAKTSAQVTTVKISNNKHQITDKLQIPISMIQTGLQSLFLKIMYMFRILNFGHCDLFGI